ncbi:MAG TPA: hypothetical protein VGI81_07395 [Tepidisphaeraceae bacterium]|jgi:hypothetical protein
MSSIRARAPIGAAMFALLFACAAARAHGILGARFFPPTISTDDPFAVDELAFPTVSYVKNPTDDSGLATHELDAGFEFDKEILPRLALGVSNSFIYTKAYDHPAVYGWSNLTFTAKYELWENAEHEAIVSFGLETDFGSTGSQKLGVDNFTTLAPKLYFGKGFGDLPDTLAGLRPFAVTGTLDYTFPLRTAAPNAFEWGFAIQYSLQYLQQNVKDVGLVEPFKNMIPLVEFAMSTQVNRQPGRGITTGTINPGVLYETDWFQIGAEANIPINRASGAHVGVTIQMWIYIDDIFPRTFGHPLFGERS